MTFDELKTAALVAVYELSVSKEDEYYDAATIQGKVGGSVSVQFVKRALNELVDEKFLSGDGGLLRQSVRYACSRIGIDEAQRRLEASTLKRKQWARRLEELENELLAEIEEAGGDLESAQIDAAAAAVSNDESSRNAFLTILTLLQKRQLVELSASQELRITDTGLRRLREWRSQSVIPSTRGSRKRR